MSARLGKEVYCGKLYCAHYPNPPPTDSCFFSSTNAAAMHFLEDHHTLHTPATHTPRTKTMIDIAHRTQLSIIDNVYYRSASAATTSRMVTEMSYTAPSRLHLI